MIKKLRLKFILISMISVIVVLGSIVTTINIINYTRISTKADEILTILENNNGSFNEGNNPPQHNNNFREETPFETRYFVVKIEDETLTADTTHIAMISSSQAIEYAKSIIATNSTNGYKNSYRYVYSKNKGLVIFVDCTKDFETATSFLRSSIFISLMGTFAVLILVIVLSKYILKPVEESYKKQKEFITNASHELKTPLAIISANNELIELTNGEIEYTSVISKQVSRLTNMVQNMVALSRIDEMTTIANKKEFNITNLLNDCLNSFDNTFNSNKKTVTKNIEDNITYLGNENLIKQLFSILLENANKYSISYVDIKLIKQNNKILISFKNDANNIKEENLNKVFERFYRLDETRASNIEGSGIGLSIAKEIVLLHKGKINALGTKNGEFIITIEF